MVDEPDPPRVFYGFKPKEFERANAPAPEPVHLSSVAKPSADAPVPLETHSSMPSDAPIDVRQMNRIAMGDAPLLGINAPANRENDVHGMLRLNRDRNREAGGFHVEPMVDKKRRLRIRRYCVSMIAGNLFFFCAAWAAQGNPFVFVPAVGGIGLFSGWLTWDTWFFRTD